MSAFYLNKVKDDNGFHIVHKDGCDLMPEPEELVYLGEFDVCMLAVAKAKGMGYRNVNGCSNCNKPCFYEGYVDK
ncbi:MAG TPA: hypothetical protein ENN84_10505 [Candidatus Marinimicrobia bacterium]|nr:hypothetical protein [Candidatus Neomarinimicrobiota bacterium]